MHNLKKIPVIFFCYFSFIFLMVPTSFSSGNQIFNIEIVNQIATGAKVEKSGGLGVIRVSKGDLVKIYWKSDQKTDLHLHGYNIKTKLSATGNSLMVIEAKATGRFSIEAHGFGDSHKHKTLIYLEVLPR
ncbi:MAG: hypothetical protein CL568_06540 [Alphaproteobacteria bacterium]|nr:hypothetical protein [Alphaproteobacteria bacterium]PPR12485.1 MAG: hypothetical protein CFH42_02171 [Alphaproteobacteria bacterium MarineAlpha12_Bin1]|tara:strand:- start:10127 stop:10516 length:390 start_codon:yes stop_codon:yes gene_type:complete